ncbi:MAG: molybdopterin-dependent oxidoreductase [Chloroflexi bacterium]|nr:molybdopterin-dependent oxidoreductase [Chloroflexota bacterium]
MQTDFAVIGASTVKVDGIEKVTGAAMYAADVMLPGMLYGKIKRSPHPHAKIVSINAGRALALPGVETVLTPDNVPRVKHKGSPAPRGGGLVADQYIFADKARFVGDGLAAVAALSEEIAEEALALIDIEYELLEAVFDIEEAMRTDAPKIHDTEMNLVGPPFMLQRGDVDQGFAEADFLFEHTYSTGRPSPCYMEPNACVCTFENSGKLTIWSSTQSAFMVRGILSEVLDIPLHKIRVIVEHMGGGFGAKQDLYQHEFVCALLAAKSGRPVKMEYTRKEAFMGGRSRHPVTVNLKQGVRQDGTLTARQVLHTSNTGAYASHGLGITAVGCLDIASLYRCEEHQRIEGRAVYTNNPIAGAFRGFGAVQAFFALDSQMDEIAHALNIDPVELRLKNAAGDGDRSPSGHPILGNGLAACLVRGEKEMNWIEERKKTAAQADSRIRRGWGVGTEMHSSGAYPDIKEVSNAILNMNEDGTVKLFTGVADLGTGSLTVMAQIAAEELGIPFKDIQIVYGDTDAVPFDLGAYASRTTYVGGGAVKKAATNLKSQLLALASGKMEVAVEDLEIRDGIISVKGVPSSRVSVKELIQGEGSVPAHTLIGQATHHSKVAYSFAAHFAEVEVDIETGQIQVKQVVAVHEVGQAVNPIGVEGQIEGGIQQGIGHSLTEDYVIDKQTGQSLNASFVDYKMPLAMDMPKIKSIILEEVPHPTAPFGAKGVGEDPIIAIGPAIANAVFDAIGIRFRELPITPEKVLQALKEKQVNVSS